MGCTGRRARRASLVQSDTKEALVSMVHAVLQALTERMVLQETLAHQACRVSTANRAVQGKMASQGKTALQEDMAQRARQGRTGSLGHEAGQAGQGRMARLVIVAV